MAEMIFREIVIQRGVAHKWIIDSAGTETRHPNESPDGRSIAISKKYYPTVQPTHKSRQILPSDFLHFEYILCMDNENMQDLKKYQPPQGCSAIIRLFGSYGGKGEEEIEDPYYGGPEDFVTIFEQIKRSSHGLLNTF